MFYVFAEKGIVITASANVTKLNGDWRTDFQKLVYNTISKTDYNKRSCPYVKRMIADNNKIETIANNIV